MRSLFQCAELMLLIYWFDVLRSSLKDMFDHQQAISSQLNFWRDNCFTSTQRCWFKALGIRIVRWVHHSFWQNRCAKVRLCHHIRKTLYPRTPHWFHTISVRKRDKIETFIVSRYFPIISMPYLNRWGRGEGLETSEVKFNALEHLALQALWKVVDWK